MSTSARPVRRQSTRVGNALVLAALRALTEHAWTRQLAAPVAITPSTTRLYLEVPPAGAGAWVASLAVDQDHGAGQVIGWSGRYWTYTAHRVTGRLPDTGTRITLSWSEPAGGGAS